MAFPWNWWVAQGFAFICLIFIIISFQQRTTTKLIWLRNISTIMLFIGLCFLGNISAIIMCGAGVIRNAVALFFAYKPQTKSLYRVVAGMMIIFLLIALNVIFWVDYFNIFSITLGAINVIAFLQTKAARIRKISVIAEIIAVTYFSLLLSPINIVIEVVGLSSAIVGVIRLDIRKKG